MSGFVIGSGYGMSMTGYVALLRGIMPSNPNMSNAKLRGVFENLGFEGVASFLSSGNIVFQSADTDVADLEDRIQRALNRELGIPGGTIIRSGEELQALIDLDPFPGLTHGRETYLTATFLKDAKASHPGEPAPPDSAAMRVVTYDPAARAVLAIIDNSTPTTPNFMGWLESAYGKDVTTRTWLTVQRVLKKLDA